MLGRGDVEIVDPTFSHQKTGRSRMKPFRNIGRSSAFVLSILIFATVALSRCMNESADGWSSAVGSEAVSNSPADTAAQTERPDPCAVPKSDPTFVQTSTAMIEGTLTVSCYDQKKQRVKRKVFVDDSDTDHVTFERIYVSQGPHVVKLEGKDYTPPCRVVTIEDGGEYKAEFSLVGGK
jgi:hypothetical protein